MQDECRIEVQAMRPSVDQEEPTVPPQAVPEVPLSLLEQNPQTIGPGYRIDDLRVLQQTDKPEGSNQNGRFWLCLCACGNTVVRRTAGLTQSKYHRSCGCYRIKVSTENVVRRCTTHGMASRGAKRSRTYNAWANMIRRCKPDSEDAGFYHNRGISVCGLWHSFENFLEDMGECPPGLTIDRRDPNGNYEKGNCRWATWELQQNNKTSNRMVVVRGETMTMAQAARTYGVKYYSLRSRIQILGLDPDTAIFGDGNVICPLSEAHKGGKVVGFSKNKNKWRNKAA